LPIFGHATKNVRHFEECRDAVFWAGEKPLLLCKRPEPSCLLAAVIDKNRFWVFGFILCVRVFLLYFLYGCAVARVCHCGGERKVLRLSFFIFLVYAILLLLAGCSHRRAQDFCLVSERTQIVVVGEKKEENKYFLYC